MNESSPKIKNLAPLRVCNRYREKRHKKNYKKIEATPKKHEKQKYNVKMEKLICQALFEIIRKIYLLQGPSFLGIISKMAVEIVFAFLFCTFSSFFSESVSFSVKIFRFKTILLKFMF